MVARIIKCSFKDAWYSECIGFEFNIYINSNESHYLFADPFLPIFIEDAKIISKDE